MALKKRTVIDQIEITGIGHIQVRFHKQIFDDATNEIFASEYHRAAIECGGNVDDVMSAVNMHLVKMGWPTVAVAEKNQIKAHASLKWTPAVVETWKSLKKKHEAKIKAKLQKEKQT